MHKLKQCSFVFVWVVDLFTDEKFVLTMEAIPKMSCLFKCFVFFLINFCFVFLLNYFRMRKIS